MAESGTGWEIVRGDGPVVATAIHTGHAVRSEVAELLVVDEARRWHEEDHFTGDCTPAANTRVIALTSRFEVDLNRPRDQAVYIEPEDSWGIRIWRHRPTQDLIARSLEVYDGFHGAVERLLRDVERRYGRFVVFDIHSYNHRRAGPDAPEADPELNPQINVGTGSMDRPRWSSVVDRFMRDLSSFNFPGEKLDVRENIKFRGGNFPRWVHQTFPETGCALAIELKKFYMDEWTGEVDQEKGDGLRRALASTVPGVVEELRKLGFKAA